MGSSTYEHALELSKLYGWAYGDKPIIVLTKRNLPIDRENIQIYLGDLDNFVTERLKPNYSNVWVLGSVQSFRRISFV
jgi:dihydrofolate reductase